MFSERLAIGTTSGDVELIYPFGDDASIVCNCSSTSKLTKIAWYNSNDVLVAVGEQKAVLVRTQTGTRLGSLNAPQTTDVCFSSRSHYLFCASEDHKVRIWDLKRKQSYSNLELSQPVQCVSVNRTDQLLASGLRSSQVVAHYLDQGAPTSQTASIVLDHPQKFPIVKVKFSLFQTAHMVSLSTQGDIIYWDLTKSKIVSSFLHQHTGATSACFSPVNRSLLVTAGLDKHVSMFDLVNQQQITTLVIPTGGILDLSMASDGCTISACDQTGQVLLYDLRNLKTPFQTITSASEAAILCCSFQYSAPKPQKRVLSEASSMLTPNLILRTSSEADLSHSTIHEIENPQSAPGCLSADFSVPSNQEENAPVPKISVEDTSKKPILIHQDNEPRLAQPASHEAPSVESFVPLDGQSPVKTKDEVPKFVQSDSFSKRELQERFNKIHTEISSVREELSQEIQNLHLDLLRQFHLVHTMFATRMSTLQQTNEELLEEVHFLRSENEKLKSEQDKI